MKRYWLRRKNTNMVFQRTAELAENEELEPITHEEAMACRKRQAKIDYDARIAKNAGLALPDEADVKMEKLKEDVAAGIVPPSELAAAQAEKDTPVVNVKREKTLLNMNEVELREKAIEMKIIVRSDAGAQELRDEITKATEMTLSQGTPVDDDAPVTFAAEDPVEAPAEVPAETPADPGSLEGMSRKELFEIANDLGLKREGKTPELISRITQAREAAKGNE